jgi:hypothetical protein
VLGNLDRIITALEHDDSPTGEDIVDED